ncbi:arginine--tRNA ligase [Patescibacteria group bacterium]|nr:arginine--tRNA ligase [Patescibacteria group bacterium]
MTIVETVTQAIEKTLSQLGISHETEIILEHPRELAHGDYATNIAMALAKTEGKNPRELAEAIAKNITTPDIAKVEVAGPGFINITLIPSFFEREIITILKESDRYGRNEILQGEKIITEFTDPNPFKLLHIGHVMSNTIGESLSRLFEFSGAEVKWSNYQGDVGMHVAKAIWGIMDLGGYEPVLNQSLYEQVTFLGKAYAHGATTYKDNMHVNDMQQLNKKIYERTDDTINAIYDWGRQVSLDYFEVQYKRLGTRHNTTDNKAFDYYFFESQVGNLGKEKAIENLNRGVFEESEGAIIFPGEKHGLHNRVFVNSLGLPTYESKELGLAQVKYDTYPYTSSFIITANEINEYFKVLLKAMSFVFPELAEKTTHIGHGMMKLITGKMSSRTGDVISAEDLLGDLETMAIERAEGKELSPELVSQIAVAAVKFAILKQDTSKDIIFDPEQSLSFEGDSGPYLQYTHARCCSLLKKGGELGIEAQAKQPDGWEVTELERYLYRFPEIVEISLQTRAPHRIANYLIELAQTFNTWYGNTKLVDEGDLATPYRLALTHATKNVINNGLWVLGIEAPESM